MKKDIVPVAQRLPHESLRLPSCLNIAGSRRHHFGAFVMSPYTPQSHMACPVERKPCCQMLVQWAVDTPLTKVDVHAGDRQRIGGVGIGCNNGDIVLVKADRVEQQGPSIDHADPVSFACLYCHVIPAATCRPISMLIFVTSSRPGLVLQYAAMAVQSSRKRHVSLWRAPASVLASQLASICRPVSHGYWHKAASIPGFFGEANGWTEERPGGTH